MSRTYEKVVLSVVVIIGVFIVLSLVAQFFLLWSGRITGEEAGVWRPIFDLVAVLVGGIGGFIAGSTTERSKEEAD